MSINVSRVNDQEFIDAFRSSKTVREALKKVNLKPMGGNYKVFYSRAKRLDLDISIFTHKQDQKFLRRKLSDEAIIKAISDSDSLQASLKALGLNPLGGSNNRWLKEYVRKNNITTPHWLGQGHKKGVPALRAYCEKHIQPLTEILVENSCFTNSSHLRKRLIKENVLLNKCNICSITDWQNQPLTLHLDHKSGINTDNRIDNLQLLCPNCHSQTSTYCGRNKGNI